MAKLPAAGALDVPAVAGRKTPSAKSARPTASGKASKAEPSAKASSGTGAMTPDGTEVPPTAEVLTFPESPRKRRRRRALIVAAIAVTAMMAVMLIVVFSPLLAISAITVRGTSLVPAAQVQAALEPLKGRPLTQVGEEEVKDLLGSIVQLREVSSRAQPPGTLVVTVVERVPVAVVKQGESYLLVDGDGVQLGTVKGRSKYPVPVVDGAATPMGQDVFRAVTAVLGALPSSILSQMATASAKSPDSVELKLSDGRTVVWGNAQDRELKARVLEALMKSPAATEPAPGQAVVQIFDVSVPRHPVTR